MDTKSKLAFTLAEVLIVIGIIGVIAEATLPTLINDFQTQVYKTSYKKAFSTAQQAITNAYQQDLFEYADGDTIIAQKNFLAFMSQFKTIKQCISGTNNQDCWYGPGEKQYEGGYWHPENQTYAFIDTSGMTWSMFYPYVFYLFVDTNGLKKPNQWGKDRFMLTIKNSEGTSAATGIPFRITPLTDNPPTLCISPNKCATENNYFGVSWLYK